MGTDPEGDIANIGGAKPHHFQTFFNGSVNDWFIGQGFGQDKDYLVQFELFFGAAGQEQMSSSYWIVSTAKHPQTCIAWR
jgi:hypothetical protein